MSTQSIKRELLSEAAEWRLIGLLFECPVVGWREQVRALAAEIEDADLRASAEFAFSEAGEGLYHSMFGPGGPAPPREISYCDRVQPGLLMSEISSYYNAFAYQPATVEVPDHVSVEAGFIAYLKFKEAYAAARGDTQHAAVTAEASHRFIEDHLKMIAEPLSKLLRNSGIGYLSLAGDALLRRTGPRNGIHSGMTLPVLAEGDVFDCAGEEGEVEEG